MTNDEFEKLALIAADDYDIKITSESPLDGYTDEMSFIAGATWAREQCQAEIEHKDKVFSETICRELELKAEVERLTNILGKDRMDDWKRIQDAERECERLKGELAKWPNNALQRTLNRTSEELQSEKAKSLKYREAFRQHLDVMDSINSHLGYPFSQPLINAQKKLKALEGK